MEKMRFAAIAAALAVALPAGATQKMPASAPSRAPAAKAPPARTPAAPVAQPEPAAAPETPDEDWKVGAALGFEFGLGDQEYDAVKVRIDAQRAIRQLSPETTLSFVGSLSIAHPSGKETVPVVVDPFFGVVESATVEWDANVFELVPAARLTYFASPKVSFFADGGLGLTYTAARLYIPQVAGGLKPDLVSDGVGGVLRLAGGLVFTPSRAFRVAIEAVGLNIRFGNGPGSSFGVAASISHSL